MFFLWTPFFSLLWRDQLEYIADPFRQCPILRVMLGICLGLAVSSIATVPAQTNPPLSSGFNFQKSF